MVAKLENEHKWHYELVCYFYEKYSEVDNTSDSINLVCQKALWFPHGKRWLSCEFPLKWSV